MRNSESISIGESHDALARQLGEAESLCTSMGNADIVQPWSIHSLDGTLLSMSGRTSRMLGLQPEETCRHYIELAHVQDRPALGSFLSGSVADGNTELDFRPFRQSFDNQTGWIRITAGSAGISANGFRVFTYRDVTADKEAEVSSHRLQEKAEQANIAKSRFLANISHELRTPLNAILGFSELLNSPLAGSFDGQRKSEYVQLIHNSASHLLGVLNGILDMSKIEHGMYEIFPARFNLAKCLETTAAIMGGQAELRGIRIVSEGLEDAPEIMADEKAVRQIVINLLSNAIKFSPEKALVKLSASRTARMVRLSVRDSGIGISPENIGNLGQPFFQADSKHDRKYEGTGLGLSVVRGLVEMHGGSVTFRSVRGEGTDVCVEIPIHGTGIRRVPSPSELNRIEKITDRLPEQTGGDREQSKPELRILRNIA